MGELYKIVGKRIANKRKKLCYSQEKLAEIAGLHRNHIGYVERAEKKTTLDTLQKITNALNMTFEELFKGF